MRFNLLTLFPEMFPGPLGLSLSGRALEDGKWAYTAYNIRDFATDKHKTVDDTPFGGGAGMVMRPDVIENAVKAIPDAGRLLYMSPRGRVLDQALAEELAALPRLRLRGLMAIPEPDGDLESQRRPHRALRELFESLQAQGLALDTLSMGMSADLEAAVLEGATMVRIGTAVFGARA